MLKKIILSILIAIVALVMSSMSYRLVKNIVKFRVPNTVYGFNVYTDSWNDGYFSADGTWVMEKGAKGNFLLLNKSMIKCEKESGHCTESGVTFWPHEEDTQAVCYSREYPIEKWDNMHIVYVEEDQYGRRIVTIERPTKNICATYEKLRQVPDKISWGIRESSNIMFAAPNQRECLVDSYEVVQKLQEEAFPKTLDRSLDIITLLFFIYGLYRIWVKKEAE
jgi:hypothetical protein